jgi:hypothetical protein
MHDRSDKAFRRSYAAPGDLATGRRSALTETSIKQFTGNAIQVPVDQYRLLSKAAKPAPLAPAGRKGYRLAVAFADQAIARSIVRDRRAVRLSQKALAQAAGIRVEVLKPACAGKEHTWQRSGTGASHELIRQDERRDGSKPSTDPKVERHSEEQDECDRHAAGQQCGEKRQADSRSGPKVTEGDGSRAADGKGEQKQ